MNVCAYLQQYCHVPSGGTTSHCGTIRGTAVTTSPPPAALLVTLALSVHAVPEHGMTVDGVRLTGPYFDPRTARNVTAQAGGYAFLPCSVRQLMDKVVSPSNQPQPARNSVKNCMNTP